MNTRQNLQAMWDAEQARKQAAADKWQEVRDDLGEAEKHFRAGALLWAVAAVLLSVLLLATLTACGTSPDPEKCKAEFMAVITEELMASSSSDDFEQRGEKVKANLPKSCNGLSKAQEEAIGVQVAAELMPLLMTQAMSWEFSTP